MADLSKYQVVLDDMVSHEKQLDTPQKRFDDYYISAVEIMEMLHVSRPSVNARLLSRFPAIKVGNTYIWERTPALLTYLNAWKTMRKG